MNSLTREEFLARRRQGIGGSDIAAILGVSKYSSPYQLWLDKTGRADDDIDDDRLEIMNWGALLEDVIAKEYAARNGVKIQRINQQLEHPSLSIALANLDRVIVNPGTIARWTGDKIKGASRILEIKTASAFTESGGDWGDEGTDEVPLPYFLQTQWYMGIAGVHSANIAVLFGGQKLKTYESAHDAEFFDDLLNEAGDFWNRYVITDTPPPPSSAEDARRFWTKHKPGKTVEANEEIKTWVERYSDINKAIKDNEELKALAMDKILPAIGDAELLTFEGKPLATFKANKDSKKFDYESAYKDLLSLVPQDFSPLDIEKYKIIKPGPRVFRLKK
jgi:putative phage-type endonuclease